MVRRNDVARKGRASAVRRTQRVVDRIQAGSAEVAVFHGRCRHDVVEHQTLPLAHALVADEEKRAVFAVEHAGNEDRGAQIASELIALQSATAGREEIPGVQSVVAEKLE